MTCVIIVRMDKYRHQLEAHLGVTSEGDLSLDRGSDRDSDPNLDTKIKEGVAEDLKPVSYTHLTLPTNREV